MVDTSPEEKLSAAIRAELSGEFQSTAQHHPNARSIILTHIMQARQMLRDGRYVTVCRRTIKVAQRELVTVRRLRNLGL